RRRVARGGGGVERYFQDARVFRFAVVGRSGRFGTMVTREWFSQIAAVGASVTRRGARQMRHLSYLIKRVVCSQNQSTSLLLGMEELGKVFDRSGTIVRESCHLRISE